MKAMPLFTQQKVETAPGILTSGFTGDQLMVTHLLFKAGAVGSSHSHPHEQVSIVLSGEMEFTLGGESKILKAGEAIFIPGNLVHGARALTESEVLDIFTPIRADLVEKLASGLS